MKTKIEPSNRPATATSRLPRRRLGLRRRSSSRPGTAAVEAAVCLPFFIFLLLATIDCCSCIFLKQSLTVAAYEGVRVAAVPGSTPENVVAQVQTILNQRGINNASINITPNNFAALDLGDLVTVTVTAPAQANSPVAMGFFSSTQPKGAVTLMIEQ